MGTGHHLDVDGGPHGAAERGTLTPDETWQQLEQGAAVAWWQLTTFVDVQGEQAAEFLEGIATQDMAGTEPGSARHALFLTSRAKIIAATMAYRADGDRFLLELEPHLLDPLLSHLRRYRLRARAQLAAAELGTISLLGPAAGAHTARDHWYDSPAWGVPARTFVGPMQDAQDELQRLVDEGLPLADPEAADALRIARGVPSLTDMAPGRMPAEVAAIGSAVALDKGCYLGQEPVARLHYRGRANRTLRQVRLDGELGEDYFAPRAPQHGSDADGESVPDPDYLALARPGDPAGKRVGTLSTWAATPSGEILGLAVLRREVEAGESLSIVGTDVSIVALDPSPG